MSGVAFCTFGELENGDKFVSGKYRYEKLPLTPFEDDSYNAADLNEDAFWYFDDADKVIKF